MTEQELEGEIMLLIGSYKESQSSKHGEERKKAAEVAEAAFTRIAVQLILDFHRIADAAEWIASPRWSTGR